MVGVMPPYIYQIVNFPVIKVSGSKLDCLYGLRNKYYNWKIEKTKTGKQVIVTIPSYYKNNIRKVHPEYSLDWTDEELLKDNFYNIIYALNLSVQRILI